MLRLQDDFEEDGLWWLPATPNNQIPGNFAFSQEGGPILSLAGLLRGIADTFNAARDERLLIHGVTRTGKRITLLDCLNKSRKLQFPGMCTEIYRAHIAAVGLHFESADEALFGRSYFRFEGLESWLGRRPLGIESNHETREITVKADAPAEVSLVKLADQELLAGAVAGTKDTGETETTIYSQSTLISAPCEKKSLNWHFSNAVHLESLATLTAGRHLPLTSLELHGPQEELAPGTYRPAAVSVLASTQHPTTTRRSSDEPIIRWSELLKLSPGAVGRWLSMYDKMGSVIGIVLTLIAEERTFVNVRFLLAIQALEAFHRSVDDTLLMDPTKHDELREALMKAVPKGTSSAMKDKLKGTLQFTNEPSLRQRLRSILAGVADRYGGPPAGFSKAFVSALIDTRNSETHHTPELKKKAMNNNEMYWASRRVLALLIILLIEELGVQPSEILSRLPRHQEFLQLWQQGGVL